MTPARGALMWAGFITAILTVSFAVSVTYPGKPSVPTEYPGGLDEELGGRGTPRVSSLGIFPRDHPSLLLGPETNNYF